GMEERERPGYQGAGQSPVQRFREELVALGGWFHLVPDAESCIAKVVEIVRAKTSNHVLLGKGSVVDALDLPRRLPEAGIGVTSVGGLTSEFSRVPFFAAVIGISGVIYDVSGLGMWLG